MSFGCAIEEPDTGQHVAQVAYSALHPAHWAIALRQLEQDFHR